MSDIDSESVARHNRITERDPLWMAAFAFVIRVVYNVWIHPPLEHVRSDMAGYMSRANLLRTAPGSTDPNLTFFPPGTHVLVFLIQKFFGTDGPGIAIVYALLGAASVGLTHAIARRAYPTSRARQITIGLVLALHHPWIVLGGNVLSETPFCFLLSAITYLAITLDDAPNKRTQIVLGALCLFGIVVRPQLLLSVILILFLMFHRGSLRRPLAITRVVAPIIVGLVLSAARVTSATGEFGLVSTNGSFNFALGRCHAVTLSARDTKGSKFQPPSFLALSKFEEKSGMRPLMDLDPAFGTDLKVEGKLWQSKPARELAMRCVKETGFLRQVEYAFEHLLLLWIYNVPWPSTGTLALLWSVLSGILAVPMLLRLPSAIVGKRSFAEQLAAGHIVALFITAVLFFGESRLRTPYDGLITLLSIGLLFDAATRVRRWRIARRDSADKAAAS